MKLITEDAQRVKTLQSNVDYLRRHLEQLGYEVLHSPSAIIPIMIGDTARALRLAETMAEKGVLITGFGYPVVPEGSARLRAQVSAAHTSSQLDQALGAFKAIRAEVLDIA